MICGLSPNAKLLAFYIATGPIESARWRMASRLRITVAEVEAAIEDLRESEQIEREISGLIVLKPWWRSDLGSVVYFVQAGDEGPIKVGWTTNFYDRLATIRTSNHETLSVLAVIEGDSSVESRLHRQFVSARQRGEWFAPAPELLDYIKRINLGISEKLA